MKYIIIIYIILTLVSAVSFASNSRTNLQNEIKSILKTHVDEEYNVGIIAGIVQGRKEFIVKYGSVSRDKIIAPSLDTLYEIGSISKVFTGLILAKLHLEGTVNLNDPISYYLSELQGYSTGFITLRELSTHTSGLPRLPSNLRPVNHLNPYEDYSEEFLLEFLTNHQLAQRPTPFNWNNYSNVGVGALGYILSRATGKSYLQLLEENITRPLEMSDTVVNLNSDQLTRFALPYDSTLLEVVPWDLNVLVGGGGIRSSTSDLLKFINANLYPERTPISDALKLAQEIHASNDGMNIGLGWDITIKEANTIHMHGGGTGGFRSNLGLNISEGIGYIVLTNSANSIQCISKLVFSNEECHPNFGYSVPLKKLMSYEGTYLNGSVDLTFKVIRKKNHLIFEIVGQEKRLMKALSEDKFTVGGITFIDFIEDEDGHISYLNFKQGDFSGKFLRQM